MASGILSVFDDIAALMDDVAVASKIATRKTAGILGDDLAVNAEKATGFLAARELPVLWAITKGSFINKLIIVPVALVLTALSPTTIKIVLVLGGIFLAYEGAEKIIDYVFRRRKKGHEVIEEVKEDKRDVEKQKIRSAVTTDFILSVEIIIIALGTVLDKELPIQILTVSVVALLATVGVYGLVALIVRLDDIGFTLVKRSQKSTFFFKLGWLMVKALPIIIKALGFIGTIALLLVSGGIFVHNFHPLHDVLPQISLILKEFAIALIIGSIAVGVVSLFKKILFQRERKRTQQ